MRVVEKPGEQGNVWPFNRVGSLVRHGTAMIMDRVVGDQLDARGITKRILEQPVVKAQLGAQAVQQARKTGDGELLAIGISLGAQAVLDTQDKPIEAFMPTEVTQTVISIARTLPLLEGSQLISSDNVRRVEAILGQGAMTPYGRL